MDLEEDLIDLYENAPCGYLSLESLGRIARVNATLCSMVERTQDDLVGRRLSEILTTAGGIFLETHIFPLLRMQGFFDEIALDLVTSSGAVIPVLANAREHRDGEGRVLVTRLAMFKATQRRRHERELVDLQAAERSARRELQELNATLEERVAEAVNQQTRERESAELREQFIAVLGHDLRNPLAAIDAGRRVLQRESTDKKALRILRLMGESIDRASNLISDVMDFARGQLGGGIGIEKVRGRIEPVLAQVVNEIRASHPERVLNARFEMNTGIDADPARMAQMFSNLLGNAITHGDPVVPVTVLATIVDDRFELSVANGGEPIPCDAMQQLFQPFVRGKVRGDKEGLGLGLYIASQIARAHDGRIDVLSSAEQTCFTFRMPIDPHEVSGQVGKRPTESTEHGDLHSAP